MGATSGTSDRPARSRSARPSSGMCPGAAQPSEPSSPEHCSGANRSYRCPRNMIEVARQATPGSPSTRLVYLVAAIHGQGNPDWHCYASVDTIALETQLSRRTVQYRVAALVAAGLLEPVRHPKGQQRRSRRYVVRAGVSPESLPESPRKPFPRVVGSSSATVPEAEMIDSFPVFLSWFRCRCRAPVSMPRRFRINAMQWFPIPSTRCRNRRRFRRTWCRSRAPLRRCRLRSCTRSKIPSTCSPIRPLVCVIGCRRFRSVQAGP